MERALALDEALGDGAIHEFFVAYDATRPAAEGGGPERARAHLDRALELSAAARSSGPRWPSPRACWCRRRTGPRSRAMLEEVVHADAEAVPRYRLANILAQRRARALLAHADDLFA